MARLYGANTTDRATFTQGGGFTGLNNLSNTANGFTVIGVGRRTANADNQYIASKTSAALNGWEFMDGYWDGTSTPGSLRLIVWTAPGTSARYDYQAGNAAGADATVLNQHEMMVATWSGNVSKTVNFFRGAIETPISPVANVHLLTNVVPSGNPTNSDAGANFTGWNLSRATTNSYKGDGAWLMVFSRVLSLTELRTVQAGILLYRAGVEANDAATKTRGVNIIKSVANYVMLNYQADDGTFTEYSGNNITGANTNAVVAGAESSGWKTTTAFEDDAETTIAEQTKYRYTSDNARTSWSTAATNAKVWLYGTLDPGTYPNQAVLGYDVNGVATGKLSATAVNAYSGVAIAGLAGSVKTITFQNGVRSHPDGAAKPHQGTFFHAVQFTDASGNAVAATEVAPPARTKQLVAFGDSVFVEGFLADWPQKSAPLQAMRRALPSWLDSVLSYAAGGNEYRDYCVDATARTDTVSRVPATAKAIVLALGANDKIRAHWSAATAQPNIVALINALLVKAPDAHIYILSNPPLASGGSIDNSTNALGDSYATWRTMESGLPAASSAPSRVHYTDTSGWYNPVTGTADGGTHPSTATYTGTINPLVAAIFASNPNPSTGASSHRRMVLRMGLGL